MNQSDGLREKVTVEDLRSLLEDGHELANHTFSHVSSRALPLAAFRQDVLKGQDAIRQITGGLAPTNFAYPFGEATLAAKKALGKEMASCRGIYGGLNGPHLDLNLLRANSLYGDADQLVAVERLVSENAKQKAWLIFYTHDVSLNPSRFGCTPSLLESTVSCAVRYGARISTVAAVLADLTPLHANKLAASPRQ
jgi:peptidoglycan/xylan/chitin deacetylase (PgdA/CDA1 family)